MYRWCSASLPTRCLTVVATPCALDAPDEGGGQAAGEQRVLGVALEVAAGERRAVHVHGGGEQDPGALRAGLGAQDGAHLGHERRVPRGAEGGPARQAGGGRARWAPSGCPRAPFGPSVSRTAGMPRRGTAAVVHMSTPAVRAAFSSSVSAATRSGTRLLVASDIASPSVDVRSRTLRSRPRGPPNARPRSRGPRPRSPGRARSRRRSPTCSGWRRAAGCTRRGRTAAGCACPARGGSCCAGSRTWARSGCLSSPS